MKGLIITIVCTLGLVVLTQAQVDKTIEDNAYGEEVVEAVLSKLGLLFGQDFSFLKRAALVQSNFGVSLDPRAGHYSGGIWQLNETAFESTKVTPNPPDGIYKQVWKHFYRQGRGENIRWKQISYRDLQKPLYSALAFHLYLQLHGRSGEGFPQSVEDQAEYWHRHVRSSEPSGPTKEEFIIRVKTYEANGLRCENKMDIVAVLDGSGSVGDEDYRKSKEFVAKLFSSYSLDKVRVGFVIYGEVAETIFNLESGMSSQEINTTVLNTYYPNSWTNTNAGILDALAIFESARDKRPGVPKILAVFTDGQSNKGGPKDEGGVPDVSRAFEAGLITYAVGIGSSTNDSELLQIAENKPFRKYNLKNFNNIVEFSQILSQQTCVESQVPDFSQTTRDSLRVGEQRNYRVPFPQDEHLCIEYQTDAGKTKGYYSYNPGVGKALHDGELTPGRNCFQNPGTKRRRDDGARRRRSTLDEADDYYQDSGEASGNEEVPDYYQASGEVVKRKWDLYMAVVGLEDLNDYSLLPTATKELPPYELDCGGVIPILAQQALQVQYSPMGNQTRSSFCLWTLHPLGNIRNLTITAETGDSSAAALERLSLYFWSNRGLSSYRIRTNSTITVNLPSVPFVYLVLSPGASGGSDSNPAFSLSLNPQAERRVSPSRGSAFFFNQAQGDFSYPYSSLDEEEENAGDEDEEEEEREEEIKYVSVVVQAPAGEDPRSRFSQIHTNIFTSSAYDSVHVYSLLRHNARTFLRTRGPFSGNRPESLTATKTNSMYPNIFLFKSSPQSSKRHSFRLRWKEMIF